MDIIWNPTSGFNDINVIQTATSGQTEVSPDTYTNVEVASDGRSRSPAPNGS